MGILVDSQPVFDALWGEPVTYTRAGVGSTHRISACRYILGEDEGRTSYGVYTIRREAYRFASNKVAFEPHLRDTIVRAKETKSRVVTAVDGSPWLKFWEVETSYPALYDQLDATATVSRAHANAAPTSIGFRNPNLATAYSGLLVRVQPDTRERDLDAAARVVTRSRFVCVFGSAVTLYAGDIVTVSSTSYEVIEQSEIESLGLLTFAAVERID